MDPGVRSKIAKASASVVTLSSLFTPTDFIVSFSGPFEAVEKPLKYWEVVSDAGKEWYPFTSCK